MATVELRFSALPAHVRTARLVAAAVARRSGVDEAVLDEVRLAVGDQVDELFAETRRRVDVDLAANLDDRAVTLGAGREGEVHKSSCSRTESGLAVFVAAWLPGVCPVTGRIQPSRALSHSGGTLPRCRSPTRARRSDGPTSGWRG